MVSRCASLSAFIVGVAMLFTVGGCQSGGTNGHPGAGDGVGSAGDAQQAIGGLLDQYMQALQAKDLAEVVEITRRSPGLLNHGTPGLGTITHVSAELMDAMSGGKLTHVHYRGTGPAVTACVSGEVELVSAPLSAVDELVKAGRLRALGNLAGQDSPLMPGVPTVAAAAGLPGYAVDNWGAILAPAGPTRWRWCWRTSG